MPDAARKHAPPAEISVVVPAHNEERYIGLVLGSFSKLASTVRSEIIVVDVGSTDQTVHISRALGAKVVSIGEATPGRARNFGARHASAEFLAFIDGDVVLTQDWVNTLVTLLASKRELSGRLRGAPYAVRENGSWLERHWFSFHTKGSPRYLNGGNLLISKRDFEKLGGFDEHLTTGEDVDLSARARQEGLVIEIDHGFKAIHFGYPSSWSDFFIREAWHGSGDATSLRAFFRSRIALAATFNLFFLFSALVAIAIGEAAIGAAMGLVSLGLAIAFSARRFGWHSGFARIALGVPVAFVYLIGRAAGCILPSHTLMRLRSRHKTIPD